MKNLFLLLFFTGLIRPVHPEGGEAIRLAESIKTLRELQNTEDLEWKQLRSGKLYRELHELGIVYKVHPLNLATLASAAALDERPGEALLFIHQALALDPFDKRVADNAWLLVTEWEKEHPERLAGYPENTWWIWRMTAPLAGFGLMFLGVAAGTVLVVLSLKRNPGIKRLVLYLVLLSGLVLVSLGLLAQSRQERKVVLLEKTGLLEYDDTAAGWTEELTDGVCVTLVRARAGWYLVRTPEGRKGWIPAEKGGMIDFF
jgi:hypothetical protein